MKTSKENSSNRRVKPMVRFFLRYLREIAFHRGLPFAVRIPNETTLKAMHEVEQDTDLQGYSDLDEMFQELSLSQGYQTNAAYYSQQQEDWKHADQL